MTPEEIRPYASTEGPAAEPSLHLRDYWHVVTRHIGLVVLVLVVTLGAVWMTLSKGPVYYQAGATLQINDPMEQSRGLTSGGGGGGSEIHVDPIQSEIELLTSVALATEVVDRAGLRLVPTDPNLSRTSLMESAWVSPEVEDGEIFVLRYDASGGVELATASGTTMVRGSVGDDLATDLVRISPAANPGARWEYALRVVPTSRVLGEVRDNIGAVLRTGTNLIELHVTAVDSGMAAPIANHSADVLRAMGAARVRERAARDVGFVRQQLDSARAQLNRSLNAIRAFKESEEFTNLSFEEQDLVNEGNRLADEVARHEWHLAVFTALVQGMEQSGAEGVDLVRFLAELPADANPEIRMGATRIQDKTNELDRVVTIDLKTRAHPAALALINQIELLQRELMASVRASVGVTEQKLASAAARLAEVRARQRAFPSIANELQTLELQRELDQDAYQYLLSQLYQARIMEAAAGPYVHIVDRAGPAWKVPGRMGGYLVMGAILGLVLGVAASLFVAYLDRTVRTRSEAEGSLGLPVLGTIPTLTRSRLQAGMDDEGPRLVVRDHFDRAREAFRGLRLNLAFLKIDGRAPRSILVTSPGPEEGKSTTSLNLAATLAQYGERVLLVEADLRRPVLHRALEEEREPGLTNLLIGNAGEEDVIRRDVIPNLDVIPAGPTPASSAELVGSMTMSETLGRLEDQYDRVIVDSPPVLAVTDAAGTAAFVDGVLLVLRSGHTEQRAAERAAEHLSRLGIRIFGVTLNDIHPREFEERDYFRYQDRYEDPTPRPLAPVGRSLRGALAKVKLR